MQDEKKKNIKRCSVSFNSCITRNEQFLPKDENYIVWKVDCSLLFLVSHCDVQLCCFLLISLGALLEPWALCSIVPQKMLQQHCSDAKVIGFLLRMLGPLQQLVVGMGGRASANESSGQATACSDLRSWPCLAWLSNQDYLPIACPSPATWTSLHLGGGHPSSFCRLVVVTTASDWAPSLEHHLSYFL